MTFNLTNTFFFNRECNKILVNRNFANEKQKLHFESGVLMGVGAFNLVRSGVHLVKYVFNVLTLIIDRSLGQNRNFYFFYDFY